LPVIGAAGPFQSGPCPVSTSVPVSEAGVAYTNLVTSPQQCLWPPIQPTYVGYLAAYGYQFSACTPFGVMATMGNTQVFTRVNFSLTEAQQMPSNLGTSVSPKFCVLAQRLPILDQPIQDHDYSQDQESSMDDSMDPAIGAMLPMEEARAALLQEMLSA
jgi:hypothetical protein